MAAFFAVGFGALAAGFASAFATGFAVFEGFGVATAFSVRTGCAAGGETTFSVGFGALAGAEGGAAGRSIGRNGEAAAASAAARAAASAFATAAGWVARLAEALLPLLHEDQEQAVSDVAVYVVQATSGN